ncbi:hypothetical protein ISN45_Aa03g021730 [Arabidopsis thaliana x Arabidopsis arenosa]|uniref:DUF7806 domain-containing protein n=1 Tax=Arabidopsis thaliana x Arabidopsis arenosa TaxID=1240361 RepID=A0A8T2AY12_9BRAS|nr:hypothetical protein ISN45_Aa03g021730 [Arabidopsis thaliana x Arabidopsis arenosa]
MEALYAKLYDKYSKLKKKKLSEYDEVNREQEEKFLNFVSASEELMEHLRGENQNLLEIVEKIRNEMTSIRHVHHILPSGRDDKCLEYQKLLREEEQKNKALSEEVVKLKELVKEGHPRNYEDQNGKQQETKTPETARVTTRSMRKRSRLSEDMVETEMVSPHISKHHKAKETLLVSQPQCCKTTYNGSSCSASCTFQALGEHLLGMKLSTNNEGEHVCIVASHPTTGLSFSLTFINNPTGEESELLYEVVSLGTFQRVAPEWMREVIKFSTSMCPVFFARVSRVIKLYC